jgi:membrane-bound metal-dependent hydrolase YbcI (DUF457 family)
MYFPSHLAAGLVIGKLTGDYTAAIVGSLFVDLDHFYSFFKHGLLKNWKTFIKASTSEEDPYDDQRNFFHNIFFYIIAMVIFLMINFSVGLVFMISYFVHLAMDALDGAEFYPFYPSKKINMMGPIGYFSKYDMAVSIVLVIIFLVL